MMKQTERPHDMQYSSEKPIDNSHDNSHEKARDNFAENGHEHSQEKINDNTHRHLNQNAREDSNDEELNQGYENKKINREAVEDKDSEMIDIRDKSKLNCEDDKDQKLEAVKESSIDEKLSKRSDSLITDENVKELKTELKRAENFKSVDKASEIEDNLRDILEDMGLVENDQHDSAQKRAAIEDENMEEGENIIKLNGEHHEKRESKINEAESKENKGNATAKREEVPREIVLTGQEKAIMQSKEYSNPNELNFEVVKDAVSVVKRKSDNDTQPSAKVNRRNDEKKIEGNQLQNGTADKVANRNDNIKLDNETQPSAKVNRRNDAKKSEGNQTQRVTADKGTDTNNNFEGSNENVLENKRESREKDVDAPEDKRETEDERHYPERKRAAVKRKAADYRREGEAYLRSKREEVSSENEEIMKGLEKSGELTVSGNKSPLATSESQNRNGESKQKRRAVEDERFEREVEQRLQRKIDEIKEKVKREIEEQEDSEPEVDEKKRKADYEKSSSSENGKENGREKRELLENTLLNDEDSAIDPEMHSDEQLSPHVRTRREAQNNGTNSTELEKLAGQHDKVVQGSKQEIHVRRRRANALVPDSQVAFVPLSEMDDGDEEGNEYEDDSLDDRELQVMRKRRTPAEQLEMENEDTDLKENEGFNAPSSNSDDARFISNLQNAISSNNEDTNERAHSSFKSDIVKEEPLREDEKEANNYVYQSENGEDTDRYRRNLEAELKHDEVASLHSGGALTNHVSKMKQRNAIKSEYNQRKKRNYKRNKNNYRCERSRDSEGQLKVNELSDTDLFGALPQSYHGELSRYKRVKRNN